VCVCHEVSDFIFYLIWGVTTLKMLRNVVVCNVMLTVNSAANIYKPMQRHMRSEETNESGSRRTICFELRLEIGIPGAKKKICEPSWCKKKTNG
jgi:hypothetical protein